MKLVGNAALVTGASRGIGMAVARLLAANGAAVIINARNKTACDDLAAEINASGGRAMSAPCDVGDMDALVAGVQAGEAKFGPVDILINNAGVVEPIARIEALDVADFATAIAINLTGALNAIKAVLPSMKAAGGGTVVNVSSGAAHRPLEGWGTYCTSKAGMRMLGLALALEEGANGIRVFNFKPGTVDTEMQVTIRASGVNQISQMTRDQHRPPRVPAQAIGYLCTSNADDLIGTDIDISAPGFLERAAPGIG
ncbi:MAG: SDR family oxidoreductase [Chromatiales bacterium]|nr:SDR family oxidoreductase [Chromatiales bacterium]